ncbi:MAG: hypothetical protein WCZ23_15655 [Rhodospirillaceae bacterium]
MLTFRLFPGRAFTGAVAAAALTVLATSAMAQTARDTAPPASMQQPRDMMMQQQRMQPMQPMQDREMMMQRERMQQQGAMQQRPMRTPPGAAGATPSMQERLQSWDMDRYIQMHQAVSAHQNCRAPLNSPAMSAIVQRIEAQTGEPPSPGRKLAIQDDAQFHMKEIVRVEGCADPRVKAALQMFDTTLAPAAQEATAATPR